MKTNMTTEKKADLVVVIDSLNVPAPTVHPFIGRILKTTAQTGLDTKVLVAMHSGLDPKNTQEIDLLLQREFPGIASSVIVKDNTFAYAYLKGLETAAKLGDRVIEIDSGGGHLPEELSNLVKQLNYYDIVLSTRFNNGGVNTYPWQRQLASRSATLLSNLFLDTNLTDAASGFQGFRSQVIKDMFSVVPPEKWSSAVQGPFHMYQTEIRAIVSWMHNYSYTEVPISYGLEKDGKPLPLSYLLAALRCFHRIYKDKGLIQSQLGRYGGR